MGTIAVTVRKFKPSGKWYDDFPVEVPASLNYYDAIIYLVDYKIRRGDRTFIWYVSGKEYKDSYPILLKD